MGRVKDSEHAYEQVRQATQANPDQVLLVTATSEHEFLEGFGPDTAAQITRFLDSPQESLLIESNRLWFFPFVFGSCTELVQTLASPPGD